MKHAAYCTCNLMWDVFHAFMQANVQEAKQIYQYKNIKETKCTKLMKRYGITKHAGKKQPTPNYISIRIKGNNRQCLNTIKAATQYRSNQTACINA